MKRTLSLIFVCLFVATLFVGCGSPANNAAPEAPAATQAPAAAPEATPAAADNTPAEPAGGGTISLPNQGIPQDWTTIESHMDKFPGPMVSLADWLGTNKELKGKKSYKIGVIMYSMQNEFPVLMSEAIKKRAGQVGVTVDFFDAEMDVNIELEKVENMIADGYEAIIFNPVDSVGSAGIVAKCNAAGIPAVCFNAVLSDLSGLAGSASSDHIQSGELVAQYIIEEVMGGKGTIVVPEGPFAQAATLDRSQGIYNVVRKYPDVTVLAHDTANWSRAEALSLMENWLNAYPSQIDAIVGENDEMALGCLQAVKTSGGDKKVYAGGIDCIPDALTALENGEMQCTVLQDAIAQAVIGFDIAILTLNGDVAEGESMNYWIPYELVLKDQVAEYRMRTDLSVLD